MNKKLIKSGFITVFFVSLFILSSHPINIAKAANLSSCQPTPIFGPAGILRVF
jgi:hypothetical protein